MRSIAGLIGLVALVAAACGGSPPASAPVSPGAESPGASASASTPAPPASAATGQSFTVRLPAETGKGVRVTVHDPDHVLTGIRLSTPTEAASIANTPTGGDANLIAGKGNKALVVGWTASVCDKKVELTVQGTYVIIAPAPRPECDAMAVGRSVTLKFALKVDADTMHTTYVPPPPKP
jgi:virulence-associated protein VagC